MNIKAGAAYVELMLKSGGFNKGLNTVGKRLTSFGRSVGMIGAATAAAGAAVMGPMVAMAMGFADTGDKVHKMAARTGLAAEDVSRLGYAAGLSGTDLETLGGGMAKMSKTISAAMDGNKAAVETLDDLGLSVSDLATKSQKDRLLTIADAIAAIPDPARRAAASIKIFGGAGMGLLPMLSEGADGIRAMGDEADQLNLTISTEDANNAAALNDAMDKLKKTIAAVSLSIGSALAPMLTEVFEIGARLIGTVVGWIKENKTLVATIFKVAAGVAAGGVAIVALGAAIIGIGATLTGLSVILGGIGTAIGFIGSIVAAVMSPVGALVVGVAALAGYLLYATDVGGSMLDYLLAGFNMLKDEALNAFGAIGHALAAGDISAAAAVLWAYLKMQWTRGVNFIKSIWYGMTNFISTAWDNTIHGINWLLIQGVSGIQTAWVETMDFLADAWAAWAGGVMKSWNNVTGFLRKAWVRLKSLINSDVDVQAEISAIDANTNEANAMIDRERDNTVSDREAARRIARAEIDAKRNAMLAGNDNIAAEKERQRQERAASQEEGLQADIDAAKAELEAAQARAYEAKSTDAKSTTRPDILEPPEMPELELSAGATATIDGFGEAIDKSNSTDVTAGFSALGMGFGGSARAAEFQSVAATMPNMATATANVGQALNKNANGAAGQPNRALEATANNTAELVRLAKRGKLVFT